MRFESNKFFQPAALRRPAARGLPLGRCRPDLGSVAVATSAIFDVGARASFANEVRAELSGASFLRPRVAPELAAGHRSGAAQRNVYGCARPPAHRYGSFQARTRCVAVGLRCCEDGRV